MLDLTLKILRERLTNVRLVCFILYTSKEAGKMARTWIGVLLKFVPAVP